MLPLLKTGRNILKFEGKKRELVPQFWIGSESKTDHLPLPNKEDRYLIYLFSYLVNFPGTKSVWPCPHSRDLQIHDDKKKEDGKEEEVRKTED